MLPQREAFFLPLRGAGERFCLFTSPHRRPKGALLYVHPFAEEMNKSRRMVALAAQEFAHQGWAVLQIDLAGCGDSSGDFGEATWQRWLTDIAAGWAWLRQRSNVQPGLWSLRGGSLLVADWLRQTAETPPLLLWQPVSSGRQHLNQFLRLKTAGQMLKGAAEGGATAPVRDGLQAGRAIEVAGYLISPALADGMSSAVLTLPDQYPSAVRALEVTMASPCEVSPATAALVANWRAAGIPATCEALPGSAFWQTQEIEVCTQLTTRSSSFLGEL